MGKEEEWVWHNPKIHDGTDLTFAAVRTKLGAGHAPLLSSSHHLLLPPLLLMSQTSNGNVCFVLWVLGAKPASKRRTWVEEN